MALFSIEAFLSGFNAREILSLVALGQNLLMMITCRE